MIAIAGLLLIWFTQQHKDKRLKAIVDNNLPPRYTPFQMARFIYGSHRSYHSALVDLLKRGLADTEGADYKFSDPGNINWQTEVNPLLLPLTQNHAAGDVFTYNEGLGYIDRETVLNAGLEKLHRLSKRVDYLKLVLPGIILAVGMAIFFHGMAYHKPVGFLVLEMGVFAVIALMILQMYSYTQTVRKHVEDYWVTTHNNGYGNDFVSNFAILGTTAIACFAEYAVLATVFDGITAQQRRSASTGSAGCGSGSDSTSSCSSGGDGGDGGGGCGGGD